MIIFGVLLFNYLKLYSAEKAKENGLSPYAYLKYLFDRLPNIDIVDESEFDKLLPWANELPQACRSGKKEQ